MEFNINEIMSTTYRALISLVTLFLITKLIGKKQVSQLSLFDYVIGISIGNFAAEMTINLDSNEVNGIIAVVIFGVIAYIVSYLTMKSHMIRKFFTGSPTILIEKGELLIENMRKIRFDIDDLLEVCRCNGYFDIKEIEYALMEANGEISILPKIKYKPLCCGDINLKLKQEGLVANVIIDSKMIKDNMEGMHISEEVLRKKLIKLGYDDLSNILLCTLDEEGKLTVYEKNSNRKSTEILE